MNLCGIICEYNPLHNGHVRHIEYARRSSGCYHIVCVMSGSFVQRGEPSVMDKYSRARHAVLAGADIVLELPFCAIAGGADDFALTAVRILKAMGTNSVSFGCETDDLPLLKTAAHSLLFPSDNQRSLLKSALSSGLSYPSALATAFPEYSALLSCPNNTLAIAYIKAAEKENFRPSWFPLKRYGSHHDLALSEIPSSAAVRNALSALRNTPSENERLSLSARLEKALPPFVFSQKDITLDLSLYEKFIYSFVQTLTPEKLSDIYGVTEGLENRIMKFSGLNNYYEFITAVKTRRYTLLRLKRILMCAAVGYDKTLAAKVKELPVHSRVLAVKKEALNPLMRRFGESGLDCPVLSVRSPGEDIRADAARIDLRATALRNSLSLKNEKNEFSPLQIIPTI